MIILVDDSPSGDLPIYPATTRRHTQTVINIGGRPTTFETRPSSSEGCDDVLGDICSRPIRSMTVLSSCTALVDLFNSAEPLYSSWRDDLLRAKGTAWCRDGGVRAHPRRPGTARTGGRPGGTHRPRRRPRVGRPVDRCRQRGGGLAATRHLIELGHRRIGAVTGPMRYLCSQARLEATERRSIASGSPTTKSSSRMATSTTHPGWPGLRGRSRYRRGRRRSSPATTSRRQVSTLRPREPACACRTTSASSGLTTCRWCNGSPLR